MYRQGDVLIVPVDELPGGLVPGPRDGGRLVLARGEATGHAHVITGPEVALYAAPDDIDRLFVEIVGRARVVHEEHAAITVPAGRYRVVRQREYTPGDYRYVAD
jgi:hypothetical protein